MLWDSREDGKILYEIQAGMYSKPDKAVRNRNYHTATGNRMPYEITQCYLPPGRGQR